MRCEFEVLVKKPDMGISTFSKERKIIDNNWVFKVKELSSDALDKLKA